jgi:hypothetical protein
LVRTSRTRKYMPSCKNPLSVIFSPYSSDTGLSPAKELACLRRSGFAQAGSASKSNFRHQTFLNRNIFVSFWAIFPV